MEDNENDMIWMRATRRVEDELIEAVEVKSLYYIPTKENLPYRATSTFYDRRAIYQQLQTPTTPSRLPSTRYPSLIRTLSTILGGLPLSSS